MFIYPYVDMLCMNKKRTRKQQVLFLIVVFMIPLFMHSGLETSIALEKSPTPIIDGSINSETNSSYQTEVNMLTNLTSYREDGIPSTRTPTTVSVQFNITNTGSETLLLPELSVETSNHGEIDDNFNSTTDYLVANTSWLTPEYIINIEESGNIASSPLDLSIILDISGSMRDEIDVLAKQLVDVIEEVHYMVPDVRVGLTLYGGTNAPDLEDFSHIIIYDLTTDIEYISSILESTKASGGYEPLGDALYLTKNELSWRNNAVKLMVLLTDEPCDNGYYIGDEDLAWSIDYDGPLLYNLFEELAADDFIICSVAASGSCSLTLKQLNAAATITDGTFITIGGEYPQTSDIPDIIGELIVTYAIEYNLKITTTLSYLNSSDVRTYSEYGFSIILDDIPPQISTTTYLSEDLYTDLKYITILAHVKDISGVNYVGIFYKYDTMDYWLVSNATKQESDSYALKLNFTLDYEKLYYKVYAEDNLGNSNTTAIYDVNLLAVLETEILDVNRKKEYVLETGTSSSLYLSAEPDQSTYGVIICEYGDLEVIVLDVNESKVILNEKSTNYMGFEIMQGHTIKVILLSLSASISARFSVSHAIMQTFEFGSQQLINVESDSSILLNLNNEIDSNRTRSILADAENIGTTIYVFNESWGIELVGQNEVELPAIKCYVLIMPEYRTGELNISFNFEDLNSPEYYFREEQAAMNFPLFSIMLGIICMGIVIITKKKRR